MNCAGGSTTAKETAAQAVTWGATMASATITRSRVQERMGGVGGR